MVAQGELPAVLEELLCWSSAGMAVGRGSVGRGVVVSCSTRWEGPLLEEKEHVGVADNVGSTMTARPIMTILPNLFNPSYKIRNWK